MAGIGTLAAPDGAATAIRAAVPFVGSSVVRWANRLDRLSDDALLAALGLGEPDAAAVFVRRFQRRVFGLALTIVGDHSAAEDIAQQAFERAWRHAGSYDGRRGSVTTWLLAITRNLAIDAGRVRRAAPIDPVDLAELLGPAKGPSLDAAAIDADRLDRLRAELDLLPVEQRRAVLLATVGGRTSREIGEIEGIPMPTAKTRLRTGLMRLRTALAEEASS